MTSTAKLLKSIQRWAKKEATIRALILLGSFAKKGKADRLSDLDLAIFVKNPAAFIDDPSWYRSFAPVWNAVSEIDDNQHSRIVIYQEGAMVDFTFYPLESLKSLRNTLPEHFETGYKILIDKDKQARKLPKPRGDFQPPLQPTAETFSELFNRFWYHGYHVAKYLWRGDLWRAKHYDWALKQDLLTMMGWYANLCLDVRQLTLYEGRQIKNWVDPETYTGLMTIFGRFYPADSWRALEDTRRIFYRLARHVAKAIDITYPSEKEETLTAFIQNLQKSEND